MGLCLWVGGLFGFWGDPGVRAPQVSSEVEVQAFTRCVVELLEVWGRASVRALDLLSVLRVSVAVGPGPIGTIWPWAGGSYMELVGVLWGWG